MKKHLNVLLGSLFMCLLLAGCGSKEAMDRSNTLIYGSGDYTRINPALDEHGEINSLIFDGLTDHDGNNKIVPRLAKSWEYDEENHTYTFHLEEGVKWHDGEPFTAEDVRFTFETIMNPENHSENAPNYEEVKQIIVEDEHTVAFVLDAPDYAFLDYCTMAILPRHLLEGENMQESEFFRSPVGTGPYMLEEWNQGQWIMLTRNPDYFAGPAQIDRIVFKIVEDDSARALQLQSGELDLAQVSPKEWEGFQEKPGFVLYDMNTSDYRGILYNFNNSYWQENADLIPAINYAIDRQAILDAVVLGHGQVAYSPIQKNPYYDEEALHYDYDPARAAQLFLEAGCEKDEEGYWCRAGKRIGFTIEATYTDQVRIEMATVAAAMLQQAGLDVKADVPAGGLDWNNQECCIIGWGSPFDADDHTYKVFGTGKGANYSAYSNPKVDEYLTLARHTGVDSERAHYYALFQEELTRKPPYTFFCYLDAMYVASARISGIEKDTVLGHHGVGIFWNVCDWRLTD